MFSQRGQIRCAALVFALSCAALRVEAVCPQQCSCPSAPPSCPPGISLLTDSCGCCKLCARQFNQDCGPDLPCDHIRGLRCQAGAGERGVCRALSHGRPCQLDGRVYQHGEVFMPSCQHQCSCMDGVVGCMSVCPHTVPLSRQRCQPASGCCHPCLFGDDNRISEGAAQDGVGTPPDTQRHLHGNEVIQGDKPLPKSHDLLLVTHCPLLVSNWSPCSTTCGTGVSSRVTNNSPSCQLVRETRLCQVRPCDLQLTHTLQTGSRCRRTVRPHTPVHIQFANCSSLQLFRPRWCGLCASGCCSPSLSRTVTLRFSCPTGEDFTHAVMWVQRCHCDLNCPSMSPSIAPSVPSDIHTYAT